MKPFNMETVSKRKEQFINNLYKINGNKIRGNAEMFAKYTKFYL